MTLFDRLLLFKLAEMILLVVKAFFSRILLTIFKGVVGWCDGAG